MMPSFSFSVFPHKKSAVALSAPSVAPSRSCLKWLTLKAVGQPQIAARLLECSCDHHGCKAGRPEQQPHLLESPFGFPPFILKFTGLVKTSLLRNFIRFEEELPLLVMSFTVLPAWAHCMVPRERKGGCFPFLSSTY